MIFTKDDTKIMKAFAIMLMLYHHLFGFPDRIFNNHISFYGEYYSLLLASFGKLCVTIFIFLSGYSIYISLEKNNVKDVLKKRIIGLYKIFWSVFIIFVPICLILGKIKFNLLDIILNFTGIKITINTEWWFLFPYIILIFISPLIIKLMKKLGFISNLIIIILINIFCLEIVPIIQLNNWTRLLNGNLIFYNLHLTINILSGFMMGILFAKYNILSYFKNKYSNNYLYVIISFIVLLFIFYLRTKLSYTYDYIYTPIFIICLTIIFNIKNKIIIFFRKILIKIGNESTIIWLTHSFYCYTLCQKFIFIPKFNILIFIWLLIISYFTSIVIKYIFNILSLNYKKILKELEIR